METLQLYSLRTFRTHTIRIRNGHKHKKYVQSIRRECFNGTLREHVYILLRNNHTKHSANVSCIFLVKTLKIYSLRTFQTHTMRIWSGHKHKNMFEVCAENVFIDHSENTSLVCGAMWVIKWNDSDVIWS